MMEPVTYRLELEQLMRRFPDKSILTRAEVARYTGHSRAWNARNLGVAGDVTLVNLAYKLSTLEAGRE